MLRALHSEQVIEEHKFEANIIENPQVDQPRGDRLPGNERSRAVLDERNSHFALAKARGEKHAERANDLRGHDARDTASELRAPYRASESEHRAIEATAGTRKAQAPSAASAGTGEARLMRVADFESLGGAGRTDERGRRQGDDQPGAAAVSTRTPQTEVVWRVRNSSTHQDATPGRRGNRSHPRLASTYNLADAEILPMFFFLLKPYQCFFSRNPTLKPYPVFFFSKPYQ